MRLANKRMAVACLICGGLLALLSSVTGIESTSALAAASSQCEPLPAATPSASPSATAPASSQGELCVSAQATGTSVKAGQAAAYAVQVSVENGSAAGVSVTLTAAPSGSPATFTSRCPSGNGGATCVLGSMGGTVSPSSFQMQAQIKVASGTTAGTSVTLTATADAATSPALAAMPAAAATAPVIASSPSASPSPSPSPSKSASSTPATSASPTQAATVTPPALAPPPTLGAMPPTVASSPLISPVSVASALPEITPPAVTPVAVTPASSPAADTGPPTAGNFTVQIGMSAATAQLLGFVLLGFVLLLAATKLVNDQLTARRNQRKEPGAKAAKVKKGPEAGKTRLGFRRSARLGGPAHGRAGSRRESQPGAGTATAGRGAAGSRRPEPGGAGIPET